MTAFLAVLKIIGIVLLVIISVLLAIILLVLFVPVRYYVDGKVDETNLETETGLIKDRIYVKAGFSWLLHILRGRIIYPESTEFSVWVLFLKVFPLKKTKNSTDTQEIAESEESENPPTEMEEGFEESSENKDGSEDVTENSNETVEENNTDTTDTADNNSDENEEVSEGDETEKNEETDNDSEDNAEINDEASFLSVLKKIKDTIIKIIKTPQDVFTKIKCTISSIYVKIDMIKKTLENDIFKRAFEVTKKQILRVLKMILPKKCRINIRIGLPDPITTADIFAAYGILYPILVGKVYMTPEFEKSVIEGKVHIRGKIRVFTIVWAAAVLFFNKDVKKTIKRFQKIAKS